MKSDLNVVESGDSMKTRTNPCINMEPQLNAVNTRITFATVTKKTSLSELLLPAPFRRTNDAGIISSNIQRLQKFSSYVDDFYN